MTAQNKILVVEDNDFVRMQIVKFLGEEGHDIIESTDGKDALAKMNQDVSLAIVDVRMEPIDGFEFVKAIFAAATWKPRSILSPATTIPTC
jgi:CheY-like chemotaxis protein